MIIALKVLAIIFLSSFGLGILVFIGVIIYAAAHRSLYELEIKVHGSLSDLLMELLGIAMSIIILCL